MAKTMAMLALEWRCISHLHIGLRLGAANCTESKVLLTGRYTQNPSMSAIEMFQQLSFWNAANSTAFIDLPVSQT
jgi:hypothetical protein